MKFVILLAFIASSCALPLDVQDEPNYRIQRDLDHISYELAIDLTNIKDTTKKDFKGEVSITFTPTKKLDQLQLHGNQLTIEPLSEFTIEGPDNADIFTIKKSTGSFDENVPFTLKLTYSGSLRDDMQGIYVSGDGDNKLASTQFESTSARKAFPCFDEPELKANFQLTLKYPNDFSTVLSNTKMLQNLIEGENAIAVFEKTEPMSTYLLAFVVSKLECKPAADTKVQVCGPKGNTYLNRALKVAPSVLKEMQSFTQIDYYNDMKMKKMDLVAIPEFKAGAMENWGLVTFRDVDIFVDDEKDSARSKQRVSTVVAHELAHQWFGDFVTLDWWSDTFLNEGFATYFEYFILNNIEEYTNMELDKQFVVEQLQTAFDVDSSINSKALSTPVNTPDEISQHFDSISYNKGGSILRMVENIVTTPLFKSGLNKYLLNNENKIGTPDVLWDTIGKENPKLPDGTTLPAIMKNWVEKPGYPIISVEMTNSTTVKLTQKQFLEDGTSQSKEVIWSVPIAYITSEDKDPKTLWLTKDSDEFNLEKDIKWIIVNDQQIGYYRVSYDKTLLDEIIKAENIDPINKAEIIDDLFNIPKISNKEYGKALGLIISMLESETSYYPWYAAFRGFTNILKRIDNEKIIQNFEVLMQKTMEKLIGSVTDKSHIELLKKELTSNWQTKINHPEYIKTAVEKFKKFQTDPTKNPLDANERAAIYCAGIKNNGKEAIEFMWGQYKAETSVSDKDAILKSLGCATKSDDVQSILKQALISDSPVKQQDKRAAYVAILSSNKKGVDEILFFIKDKSSELTNNKELLTDMIKSSADYITNLNQQNTLTELGNTFGDMKEVIDKLVKETVTKNLEKTKVMQSEFEEYFKESPGGASQNVVQLTSVVATLLVVLYNLL